jgi:DNA-binding response OmpR family regulator
MPRPTRRALIVEDDADVREFLAFALRQDGYATSVAADAAEAIELLRRDNPDLVVLDIVLPDGDGFAVLHEAHARPLRPRIVVVSASGLKQCQRARSYGADDCVPKPFGLRRLYDACQGPARAA